MAKKRRLLDETFNEQFRDLKRTHLSLSDFAASLVPSQKFFFDLLPAEVNTHIAAMLTNHQQSPAALTLVEACPNLRYSVAQSLKFTCILSRNTDKPAQWTKLFGPEVVSVRMCAGMVPSALPLLLAKSLKSAYITDDLEVLRTIAGNTNIRSLYIVVNGNSNSSQLLATISSLKLLQLVLHVKVNDPSKCPFHSANPDVILPTRMAFACMRVTSLSISCSHTPLSPSVHIPIWCFVKAIPAFKMVTISHEPPPEAIEILSKLKRVSVHSIPNGLQVAVKIGAAVTSLRTSQSITEDQIPLLMNCPRLTELVLRLSCGADEALVETCRSLKSLIVLYVTYDMSWHSVASRRKQRWWLGLPFQLTKNVFPRLASTLPNLKWLGLSNVRISMEEVTDVLRTIGKRLEWFFHSSLDQTEPPLDRLEATMNALWQFNPNLKGFADSGSRFTKNQVRYLQTFLLQNYLKNLAQKRRIEITMDLLRRRNPSIVFIGLETLLNLTKCDLICNAKVSKTHSAASSGHG